MELKSQQFEAVVIKKQQLTSTVFHFFLHVEQSREFFFTPGQYVTVMIDEKTRRQYSVCSDPKDTKNFELVIDTIPMGPGSKYFLSKQEGERIPCLGPLGNFSLNDNPLKKVFVATGAGIAPFRSMMLDRTNKTDMTNMTDGSLYWGIRHERDIYWDNEIRGIAGQLTGFRYFLTLSKPGENWQGLRGHVTEHIFQNEKNIGNSEFYLCGNNAMITEMKNKLSALNIPNERIKIDLYF